MTCARAARAELWLSVHAFFFDKTTLLLSQPQGRLHNTEIHFKEFKEGQDTEKVDED
jgi:hypothetical protein